MLSLSSMTSKSFFINHFIALTFLFQSLHTNFFPKSFRIIPKNSLRYPLVQYRGNVYYLDASNGRWVQYSANGLDNISAVKMSRFWKNWCYKYLSMTKAEIEAFGNRPYVFATVDPGHDELLVTIPRLSYDPPKGYLPDYPAIVYPFDILDYTGKTISYKLGTGAIVQPHWQFYCVYYFKCIKG